MNKNTGFTVVLIVLFYWHWFIDTNGFGAIDSFCLVLKTFNYKIWTSKFIFNTIQLHLCKLYLTQIITYFPFIEKS